ncbi:hypothetical protein C8R44DRAFT_553022, partial [Mycena epipterygia]
IPTSPLNIPGILNIGPKISMEASVTLDIGATGQILARTSIGWKNINAIVDMVNGQSRIGEWERTSVNLLTSVELTGKASISPSIKMALLFGITILEGKFEITGGVEAK